MTTRKLMAGLGLCAKLLVGGGGIAAAQGMYGDSPSCFGQHVTEMATQHHGMRNATNHHNVMNGTDITVGEHMALKRDCPMLLPDSN